MEIRPAFNDCVCAKFRSTGDEVATLHESPAGHGHLEAQQDMVIAEPAVPLEHKDAPDGIPVSENATRKQNRRCMLLAMANG
jgi:hypothetical protein